MSEQPNPTPPAGDEKKDEHINLKVVGNVSFMLCLSKKAEKILRV